MTAVRIRAGTRFLAVAALAALLLASGALAFAGDDAATLVKDLGGDDWVKRNAAYSTLQVRKPPEAVPLILKGIASWDVTAQGLAIYVLASYPPEIAKPALGRLVADGAPFVKGAAAAALARTGDARAAQALADLLSSKATDEATLVLVFGRMSGITEPAVVRAAKGLVRGDATPAVVGSALYYLEYAQDPTAKAVAEPLLSHASPGMRAIAAAFLFRMGEEDKGDDLAAAMKTREIPYAEFLRVQPFLYNAPRLPEALLDVFLAFLDDPPSGWSVSVLMSHLGASAYSKAIPVLRRFLDSKEAGLAKAAFDALSQIPGGLDAATLKAILDGDDEARKIAAAQALRRADDLSGLPVVLDVLAHGKTSKEDAARTLADFRVSAAVEPLLAAMADDKPLVRTYASQSLATVLATLFPYRRLNFATVGWDANAAAPARESALKRIRSWWDANRSKDW